MNFDEYELNVYEPGKSELLYIAGAYPRIISTIILIDGFWCNCKDDERYSSKVGAAAAAIASFEKTLK